MYDSLNPKNAEEWHRSGRVPRGNDDIREGLKFFDIHNFLFPEGVGYSQVGDFSGYQEFSSGVATWHSLLDQWENVYAPNFPDWKGRTDMFVKPKDATRGNFYKRNFARSVDRSPFSTIVNLPWEQYREEAALVQHRMAQPFKSHFPHLRAGESMQTWRERMEEEERSHIASLIGQMPRIGKVVSLEKLAEPNLRVLSLPFVRSITATISHPVLDEVYEVPVPSAKLVVWIEMELRGEEFSWRWMGSVYSWKNCSMMSLDFCSGSTQTTICQMVMPLLREWSRLVRQVSKARSSSQEYADEPLIPTVINEQQKSGNPTSPPISNSPARPSVHPTPRHTRTNPFGLRNVDDDLEV